MPKIKNKIIKKTIGYISVNSGQILIVDPCYLSDWKDGESTDNKSHYGQCCNITLSKKQAGEITIAGIIGNGVVSSTFNGDGMYPVIATYVNGNIAKLEIELTNEKYV